MVKQSLLLATLLSVASAAHGADLPSRLPPPADLPVPIYNWSGFYVGGYVGGSLGVGKTTIPLLPNMTDGNRFNPTGFTGGAIAGYNLQFNSLVLGVEGDIGYDGRRSSQDYHSNSSLRHETFTGNYLGRLRGRVGYAWNDLLLFAAGGASFADGKQVFLNPSNGYSERASRNFSGYNVGGGVEYAFLQNWTGRLEYIYDDLGRQTFTLAGPPEGFDTRRTSLREHTVRVALEYKF